MSSFFLLRACLCLAALIAALVCVVEFGNAVGGAAADDGTDIDNVGSKRQEQLQERAAASFPRGTAPSSAADSFFSGSSPRGVFASLRRFPPTGGSKTSKGTDDADNGGGVSFVGASGGGPFASSWSDAPPEETPPDDDWSFSTPPTIGILSQPWPYSGGVGYFIAASYVKWIEAGGGRSVVIPYDADEETLDDLFYQINGILLPGGISPLPRSVTHLLNMATEENGRGRYFPVWGTCLGFEFMVRHVASNGTWSSGDDPMDRHYKAENVSLPLDNVVADVRAKSMYSDPFTYRAVTKHNITMNNHLKGISPEKFRSIPSLTSVWEITSTNVDPYTNREFVSTVEPKRPDQFPFYGVQYHPEKNAFEYGTYPNTTIPYENINHSDVAVRFTSYLARFAIRLARKQQRLQQERRRRSGMKPHHKDGGEGFGGESKQHEYTKPNLYPQIYTYPILRGIQYEQVYVVETPSRRKQTA